MSHQKTHEIDPDKFKQASENLKRIEKAIAPFTSKGKPGAQPTAGKWRETTSWSPTKDRRDNEDKSP